MVTRRALGGVAFGGVVRVLVTRVNEFWGWGPKT